MTQKAQVKKQKQFSGMTPNLKFSAIQMKQSTETNANYGVGKKYFQTRYPIRGLLSQKYMYVYIYTTK